MHIGNLGESRLIELIKKTTRSRGRVRLGIGDDAAILNDGTVITTDAYAAGIHFDRSYMTYYDIGQRCACAALSDIVAMAAEPAALLVSLCIPPHTSVRDVRELYRGMEYVCRQLNCEICGGDIIALDRLVLSLVATGTSATPRRRSGAEPGDVLYVTGYAGLAETGRLILKQSTRRSVGNTRRQKADPEEHLAITRHLCPLPRAAVVRSIAPEIHALTDTSDGIATDARHIATMSRVRVELHATQIPIAPATRRLCSKRRRNVIAFCLGSGEDYELLFTARPGLPNRIAGTRVTPIGAVKQGNGIFLVDSMGKARRLEVRGYDHLLSAGLRPPSYCPPLRRI